MFNPNDLIQTPNGPALVVSTFSPEFAHSWASRQTWVTVTHNGTGDREFCYLESECRLVHAAPRPKPTIPVNESPQRKLERLEAQLDDPAYDRRLVQADIDALRKEVR